MVELARRMSLPEETPHAGCPSKSQESLKRGESAGEFGQGGWGRRNGLTLGKMEALFEAICCDDNVGHHTDGTDGCHD